MHWNTSSSEMASDLYVTFSLLQPNVFLKQVSNSLSGRICTQQFEINYIKFELLQEDIEIWLDYQWIGKSIFTYKEVLK